MLRMLYDVKADSLFTEGASAFSRFVPWSGPVWEPVGRACLLHDNLRINRHQISILPLEINRRVIVIIRVIRIFPHHYVMISSKFEISG